MLWLFEEMFGCKAEKQNDMVIAILARVYSKAFDSKDIKMFELTNKINCAKNSPFWPSKHLQKKC